MFKKIRGGFSAVRSSIAARLSATHDSFMTVLIGTFIIIGPLFFLPIKGFSVGIAKGFFLLGIAAIIVIASGAQILRRGAISIPRGWIFGFLGIALITGLLGSILSGSLGTSLFGYGFETTTWVFTAVFTLLVFVGYFVLRSYDRIGMMLASILIPFFVLIVFHLIRYIWTPLFGNFGVLGATTATSIGSWGDLTIFFGCILLFSVITLELGGFKKSIRWGIGAVGGLAAIFLAFANVRLVWVVIGFMALALALYLFSFAYWDTSKGHYHKDRRVPGYAIALFVISLVCIVFGGIFQGLANRHQNISWNDTRPSVAMTARTAVTSFLHNPVTGYGPNLFNAAWNKTKPPALSGNETNFVQGFGWVPTHIASQGLLGAVAWIGFFGLLLYNIIRRLGKGFEHPFERYLRVVIGFSVLYLTILAWVYIPGTYLLGLLAILIGAHLGFGSIQGSSDREFSFIRDPRASFFGILGVLALILLGLLGAYIGTRKFVSFVHYARAAVAIDGNNNVLAGQEISTALVWANHDQYHVDLARFALSDAAQIAGKTTDESSKEAVSKQVEQTLGIALGHAQAAIDVNSLSYSNHILLGDIYRFMVSLGATDAVERAIAAYDAAVKRNPHDATMKLSYAQLDLAQKKTDSAITKIKESLNAYPTVNAYVLQAQIQIGQNNMSGAIVSMENAVALDPYNISLGYQYGLLLFQQKQYQSAIGAFSRVITLDRNFGSAYVYLGVAYEKSGDTDSANKIYEFVKKQWTDGAQAITQVKSGAIETPAPENATDSTTATSKPAQKTVAPAPKN